MTIDSKQFQLHDVSAFPLVRFRNEMAVAGYALAWQKEMNTLLLNGQPFVVVYGHPRIDEAHEDRKHRGLWLKHNKQALAETCRGLVSIEPDAAAREALSVAMQGAARAFGVAQQVAASEEQAQAMAHALLAMSPSMGGR